MTAETPSRGRRARRQSLLTNPAYDPNRFVNFCSTALNVENDAGLSRAMLVTPATISRIRSRSTPVPSSFLIRFHERTQIPFTQIREALGVGQGAPL